MDIVDAQVHIWGPDAPEHPWPVNGPKPHRPTPFTGDDLVREMDEAGVHRAIVQPVTFAGNHNHVCLEGARNHPERIGVMGVLKLSAPESRGRLATWRDQPGMLGIRINLRQRLNRELFSEGKLDWVFAEAQEAGVPMMFLARHEDLHLMHAVASRYPDLKLGLDHLGLTGEAKGEEAFSGFDEVLKLSVLPNMGMKVSNLPHFAPDAYPYKWLHPYLRRVYDAFGPQRMFWGTDLTRGLPCTYRQAVTMFTEEIPWLNEDDKEWIMGRALCAWIGWEKPRHRRSGAALEAS